ncbi:MAG: phosphatase PAP2 family protein [Gemmiger sp.]|nr:phosphatase PAP2 family protein [Gemmiger sp.]
MKTTNTKNFITSAGLLIGFVLFTLMVQCIDVKPIGPQGSPVGFATLNGWVHNLFGVHWALYTITDWASILTLPIMLGFAAIGLRQWMQRKSLSKVDSSIIVLGGFYILVFACYLFFECNIINYRPVLIGGLLEASYPSSTTMLVLCVMPTAMLQFGRFLKNRKVKNIVNGLCGVFTVLMVMGRLLSGVHWFTDILGGALFSAGAIMLYFSVNTLIDSKKGEPTE